MLYRDIARGLQKDQKEGEFGMSCMNPPLFTPNLKRIVELTEERRIMNNVIISSEPEINPRPGDLFKNSEGDVYILASVSDGAYCAINLSTGQRWREPTIHLEDAIHGLHFLQREAQIKIL